MASTNTKSASMAPAEWSFSKGQVGSLQKKLLAWYHTNKRDLPWRKKPTPYRVWVSEIMLQQTQVATVIPYFNRFLKSFPNVKTLAAADESEVLKLWEGLGYYRRARQLHAAARKIVTDHRGRFPKTYEEVLALPGVGRYTAGAILSISTGQRLPILEGNTIRLFSRLLAFNRDVKSTQGQAELWKFSESILPTDHVSDFNQALMELGATICTPRNPSCESCPLQSICKAYNEGDVETYPVSSPRTQATKVNDAAIWIPRAGKVLVRECQPGEVWAGLWDFPRFRIPVNQSPNRIGWLEKQVLAQTGISVTLGNAELTLKHAVTRYNITLDCHIASSVSGRLQSLDRSHQWIKRDQLSQLPLSVTGRKIANRLCSE